MDPQHGNDARDRHASVGGDARPSEFDDLMATAGRAVANSDELIFILDVDRRIAAVSRGLTDRVGLAPEDLLGRHCYEHTHRQQRPPDDCPFADLLHGAATAAAEVHSETLGGDFRVTITAVTDADGRFIAAVHSAVDITEHKATKEALAEANGRLGFLAEIIELAEQPIAVGYSDGRIGFFNAAFCRLTGYGADELRRMTWSETLTPEEWRAEEQEILAELVRTGRPQRYEKEYLRKDGTRVPVEFLTHVVKDDQGEPQYFYAFITDITDRRRSEDALRAASLYSRSLLEAALDPLVTISPDGTITDVNRATEQATGLPRETLIGTDFSDYFTDPEAARAGYRLVFSEGLVRDYPLRVATQRRHRHGRALQRQPVSR